MRIFYAIVAGAFTACAVGLEVAKGSNYNLGLAAGAFTFVVISLLFLITYSVEKVF